MSNFNSSEISALVNPLNDFEHGKACMNEAAEFFKKVFQYIPDGTNVYLWLDPTDGGKKITKSFVKTDGGCAKMAREAVWANGRGNYNVYFGVNPPERELAPYERAKTENVILQTAIITDIDIESAWHVSDDERTYPKDFDTAKSFLPFEPSILVDSGGGLHAYYLLKTPLTFNTMEERDRAISRNRDFIAMVEKNAGIYSGAVDAVHDLPRVLRVPGTYNIKRGWQNAPLCKVVSVGSPYTIEELDKLIIPREKKTSKEQKILTPVKSTFQNEPSDIERACAMLEKLPCAALDYNEWCEVGMALKNNGNTCDDWTNWSRLDDRFKDGECESKWKGFNRRGLTIATIYKYSVEKGTYNEKEFRRKWYKSHGSAPNDDFDFVAFNSKELETAMSERLQEVNFKLADFDAEVKSNVEKLKNQSTFDRDSVFADDFLTAAAFARLYDSNTFCTTKAAIQNYIDLHNTDKYFRDWLSAVKEKTVEISGHKSKLENEKKNVEARISSSRIYAADDILRGLIPIDGYSVSAERGVEKVVGERLVKVCAEPIAIKGVLQSYYDEKTKLILSHMRQGKWKNIPPQPAENISSRKELVKLAAYNFPIADHNSLAAVEYLYELKSAHLDKLPFSYTVPNCGWHDIHGENVFVEPRRNFTVKGENGKDIPVTVDNSSTFAKSLKSVGTLDQWTKAYRIAKTSPVARLTVAAAIAPPLLNIIGERNFLIYLQGMTGSGKSSCLYLAASAIGDEKIIRSFDGTRNGLLGSAADVNDFAFLIDEKQVADERLKDQIALLVYALGNGIGRLKLNRDSTVRDFPVWRIIGILTGESDLFKTNVSGGAYTRLITIRTPQTILDADSCRDIRQIIKHNYGLVFPLVLDKYLSVAPDKILKTYDLYVEKITQRLPELLPVHCRYLAVTALADGFLQSVLFGVPLPTEIDGIPPFVLEIAESIAPMLMTQEELSDTEREKDFVLGFVSAKAAFFENGPGFVRGYAKDVLGSFSDKDKCVYLAVRALQQACDEAAFNYEKVVADLIADNFFETQANVEKGRKKPRTTFTKKINGVGNRCYKISKEYVEVQEQIPYDFD